MIPDDCFSGRLQDVEGRPREVAPFPRVNPLTGPVCVRGAVPGDLLAVHLRTVEPARDWGVATVSPSFGALSGTRLSPNLQPETEERVWIWHVDVDSGTAWTTTRTDTTLRVPLAPFHGTVAVAPPHGEVRTSVVPDAFGGNLDVPLLGAGSTLYLRVNVPGAMLSIGDGHYAQGDGELAGTAVEGAMRTTLVADVVRDAGRGDWPRIETDTEIAVVGCGRPLEEAVRVAAHELVRWVAADCGLDPLDAYQLVSQACSARVSNLVNPAYTMTVSIPKRLLPRWLPSTHERLRRLP